MRNSKFLIASFVAVLVLIAGLVTLVFFDFNYGFDFSGGSEIVVVAKNYEKIDSESSEGKTKIDGINESRQLIYDVFNDNKVSIYQIKMGEEESNTIFIVKYQLNSNIDEETEKDLVKDLFTAFDYNSDDDLQKDYVSLNQDILPSVDKNVFVMSFYIVLLIAVLSGIYLWLRHSLTAGVVSILSSISSVVLMLAITAIFRIPVTSSIETVIILTAIISNILSFVFFNRINAVAKNEDFKHKSNFQIAEEVSIKSQKPIFYIVLALIFVFVALFFFVPFEIKMALFSVIAGILFSGAIALFIVPSFWALAYLRVYKQKEIKNEFPIED